MTLIVDWNNKIAFVFKVSLIVSFSWQFNLQSLQIMWHWPKLYNTLVRKVCCWMDYKDSQILRDFRDNITKNTFTTLNNQAQTLKFLYIHKITRILPWQLELWMQRHFRQHKTICIQHIQALRIRKILLLDWKTDITQPICTYLQAN